MNQFSQQKSRYTYVSAWKLICSENLNSKILNYQNNSQTLKK